MKISKQNNYDFAISYAGEDIIYAQNIYDKINELGYSIFFAKSEQQRIELISKNGEKYFEKFFSESTLIIALISSHYKNKKWPRFEFDIINKRKNQDTLIPIKLDDTIIAGLPSNIFYLKTHNYNEVIETCIKKYNDISLTIGLGIQQGYDEFYDEYKRNIPGASEEAYQLVIQKSKRNPLENCIVPKDNYEIKYSIISQEWFNFSVIKRLAIKIYVPNNLLLEELRFNLKHCSAIKFNELKPDGIKVYAYQENDDINQKYTVGQLTFAPFGRWEKAQDGFVYNIPTKRFEYSFEVNEDYFKH